MLHDMTAGQDNLCAFKAVLAGLQAYGGDGGESCLVAFKPLFGLYPKVNSTRSSNEKRQEGIIFGVCVRGGRSQNVITPDQSGVKACLPRFCRAELLFTYHHQRVTHEFVAHCDIPTKICLNTYYFSFIYSLLHTMKGYLG